MPSNALQNWFVRSVVKSFANSAYKICDNYESSKEVAIQCVIWYIPKVNHHHLKDVALVTSIGVQMDRVKESRLPYIILCEGLLIICIKILLVCNLTCKRTLSGDENGSKG